MQKDPFSLEMRQREMVMCEMLSEVAFLFHPHLSLNFRHFKIHFSADKHS